MARQAELAAQLQKQQEERARVLREQREKEAEIEAEKLAAELKRKEEMEVLKRQEMERRAAELERREREEEERLKQEELERQERRKVLERGLSADIQLECMSFTSVKIRLDATGYLLKEGATDLVQVVDFTSSLVPVFLQVASSLEISSSL